MVGDGLGGISRDRQPFAVRLVNGSAKNASGMGSTTARSRLVWPRKDAYARRPASPAACSSVLPRATAIARFTIEPLAARCSRVVLNIARSLPGVRLVGPQRVSRVRSAVSASSRELASSPARGSGFVSPLEYEAQAFRGATWAAELLGDLFDPVPRRLCADCSARLGTALRWHARAAAAVRSWAAARRSR